MIQIESQAWWGPEGQLAPQKHLHLAVKAPIADNLSDWVQIPIRIVLHDFPSAKLTMIRVKDPALGLLMKDKNPSHVLWTTEGNVKATAYTVVIQTKAFPDGWHAPAFYVVVQDDGKEMFTSVRFQVYFDNRNERFDTVKFSPDLKPHPVSTFIANAWRQEVGYATIAVAPDYFQVTPIRPHEIVVYANRSHVIPAVGIWEREEANIGQLAQGGSGDEEIHQFLYGDIRMWNINAAMNKHRNGNFLSVVARRWNV